jgi:hypothetical protein
MNKSITNTTNPFLIYVLGIVRLTLLAVVGKHDGLGTELLVLLVVLVNQTGTIIIWTVLMNTVIGFRIKMMGVGIGY